MSPSTSASGSGRPTAEYAGDPAMHDQHAGVRLHPRRQRRTRRKQLEDRFTGTLKRRLRRRVRRASRPTVCRPSSPAPGKDIITQLKEAGVTTVVFSGDPLAPADAHADRHRAGVLPGVGDRPARRWSTPRCSPAPTTRSSGRTPSGRRTCSPASTPEHGGLAVPLPVVLRRARARGRRSGAPDRWPSSSSCSAPLQGVGPDVTHENVPAACSSGRRSSRATPITPQVSFGDRGHLARHRLLGARRPDRDLVGPDGDGRRRARARTGKGMWRFVDGGKRYLPGEWPTERRSSSTRRARSRSTTTPPERGPPGLRPRAAADPSRLSPPTQRAPGATRRASAVLVAEEPLELVGQLVAGGQRSDRRRWRRRVDRPPRAGGPSPGAGALSGDELVEPVAGAAAPRRARRAGREATARRRG